MTDAVSSEVAQLLTSLGSVHRAVPTVIRELATNTMPPEQQRMFAGLLMELADLMVDHAGGREDVTAPSALADRVGTTGRQLVTVSARLRTGTSTPEQLNEVARLLVALAEVLELYAGKMPTASAATDPPDVPEPLGP
ncbi:hypothetical protein [Amycolatopsis mediterranei]|uniref:Uncharacterized protein n=1 Tax=Amycolatopsis mediterranei (strain S699) TaxID=713604 RepID=A0A9R0NU44_AMYMS|nr:hypothetical protein [Amycolatopsis mediterranei]AEK40658.1 hypothetical protein RAM_10840 [Amycolatopsis mediterranei S699]KDO04268.1 hypothetical protein DV26_44790 [Amycolatopsis mediterranei]KDU85419.1 hypothetical protein DV36_46295 [Amycolatopsis mediterranei]UZF69140.1 hypothetical protein ISP_002268 [Amycolatopsis mediterranei]